MSKFVKLSEEAYKFEGKLSLSSAIPLGLQHVLAMFVGNLTPVLIIGGACGIVGGAGFEQLQVVLIQNAMIVAGLVTLLQLYSVGLRWQGAIIMVQAPAYRRICRYRCNLGKRCCRLWRYYGCFDYRRCF